MSAIGTRPPGALAPRRPRKQAMGEVQIVIQQQAQLIDALDRDAMRALVPVLVQARDELRHGLQAWLDANQDNDQRFTAQAYRRALLNLEAAMERVAQLDADVKAILDQGRHDAGALSADNLAEQVARFGAAFGESITPTSIDTAAVIAKGDRLLMKQHRTSAARYAAAVGDDIRHQLAVGVAMNETFGQLKARLVRLGGPRGMVALRGVLGEPGALAEHISEGLFQRYRYWAERLVRTELIQAYNVQHQQGIRLLNDTRQEGVEPYIQRWDSTLDGRACSICRRLDRTTAPIGGMFHDGRDEYEAPPAHPNCRCTVVAWHASWGDMAGEVPANENKTPPDEPATPPPDDIPDPAPPPRREPEGEPPPLPPPAELAPEAAPFVPSVGDPEPTLDRIAAGKWKAARGALEDDIRNTEGYSRTAIARPPRTDAVRVRRLRPGVRGLFDGRNGLISIDPKDAQLAQQFAERATKAAGELRANLEIANELAREADAGKRAAKIATLGDDRMRDVREDVRRMEGAHTLVHETMHGFSPIAAIGGAYKGAGAVVEEVTNEVASRRWLRTRLGIEREVYANALAADGFRIGAYNGWINGVRDAIASVYGVDDERAMAMLEAAADRYKMRMTGSIDDPEKAVRAFAEDISKQARASKDAAKRFALEQQIKVAARARP